MCRRAVSSDGPDGLTVEIPHCGHVERWGLNGDPQTVGLAVMEHAKCAPAAAGREDRKASAQARQRSAGQLRPLRDELTRTEQRMAAAGAESEALALQLGGEVSAAQRVEMGRRLKTLQDEVHDLEARWLELSESIEAAGAG